LVLYNSRAPRPGERDGTDYHFRSRGQIEQLRDREDVEVLEVRGDLQAVDFTEVRETLERSDVFYEGNPTVARLLQTHDSLAGVDKRSVFMAPLSLAEIRFLSQPEQNVCLESFVAELMRRKLLRRTRRHKGELSLDDLEDIERRATSAWREMREACHFDWVLPNHDGEDSDNWEGFHHPLGDARKALLAFIAILEGESPECPAETWDEDREIGIAGPQSGS
jgi:guanylate kinase